VRRRLFGLHRFLFSLSLRGMGILNYHNDRVTGERRFLERLPRFSDPAAYARLQDAANRHGFLACNAACGEAEGHATLFDYSRSHGSSHASLYRDVFAQTHHAIDTDSYDVQVLTIDGLLARYKLPRVTLLKIDTEGNELRVLSGAAHALGAGKIDIIQFEFNEMNVTSGVFFNDFVKALPHHVLLPG
jgi:FkbM family methyltransferase